MKKSIYIIIAIIILTLSYAGVSLYEKSHAKKTIYVVSMTADEMSAALANGTIEGFISWEPYPAKSVADGYGRYLVNSKDIWENHPSCVLAISEYLKDEDMINALVWVHVKSTRFINNPANREKVLKYGSEFTGIDRATASAAINNTLYLEFPDLPETRKGFEMMDKAGAFKKTPASMGYNDLDEFLSSTILDRYYNDVRTRLEADPDWTPPPIRGNLRFGFIDGNIHYLGVYVAQKEGYFAKVGLIPEKNIQFLRFRNGLAITNAFNQREVDIATLGMPPLLRYRINDNGKIYIIAGVNSGGTSLVVRADSDISSIEYLEGSTIATPGFGSVQDLMMRKMFEGFEIKTV
ncbi:MAG: ABC transporter substrate-binding protein [Candidatus Methanoperedens sp.]|nr:ABC transporter substrate-binding protein [Candidatus Methanoperedens sp.]